MPARQRPAQTRCSARSRSHSCKKTVIIDILSIASQEKIHGASSSETPLYSDAKKPSLQCDAAFENRQLAEIIQFVLRQFAVGNANDQIDKFTEQVIHRDTVNEFSRIEVNPVRFFRRQLAVGRQFHRWHKTAVRCTAPGTKQNHMTTGTRQRTGGNGVITRRTQQIKTMTGQALTILKDVHHRTLTGLLGTTERFFFQRGDTTCFVTR